MKALVIAASLALFAAGTQALRADEPPVNITQTL